MLPPDDFVPEPGGYWVAPLWGQAPMRQGVRMRTQEDRDEVTLVIATAVLRSLLVIAGGLLALFVARALVGGEWFVESTLWPLGGLAAVVAVVHLYKNRRP